MVPYFETDAQDIEAEASTKLHQFQHTTKSMIARNNEARCLAFFATRRNPTMIAIPYGVELSTEVTK